MSPFSLLAWAPPLADHLRDFDRDVNSLVGHTSGHVYILSLVKILNLWGKFAIYAALSCLCCIFVWKMVPETKSRTLEQIQETLSK